MKPRSLSSIASSFDAGSQARAPDGVDTTLRLTSRTIGAPIAAVLPDGAGPEHVLEAFHAGARLVEMGDVKSALQASIVLDLVRARLPDETGDTSALFTVRLPRERAEAEAVLDEIGGSMNARFDPGFDLAPEEMNALSSTRPLTTVTLETNLDAAGEDLVRALFQEWGDDAVLSLGPEASPPDVESSLDRLRRVAESSGCTLVIRVPATAPARLLSALAESAANSLPVWMHGAPAAAAAATLARGASIVSPPDPAEISAAWSDVANAIRRNGARRASDLVLFGVEPDAALQAAAEIQYGKNTWLVSPVKNAALAMKRLVEARGGTLDTPLVRESLANPPKECCLYRAEEPDLKEAATDWTYGIWVRETMRRRLPVG